MERTPMNNFPIPLFLTLVPKVLFIYTLGGAGVVILRFLLTFLAEWTYLGLYAFEIMAPLASLPRLSLPQKGWRRWIMDVCAAICTFVSAYLLTIFVKNLSARERAAQFMATPSPRQSLLVIGCLSAIYAISGFGEPDVDSAWDKMKKLSVPKLLEKFIGF